MGVLKESWRDFLRALSIKIVRYIPFIFITVVALYYLESINSINNNSYIEYVDDAGMVLSISYDTPLFSELNNHLGVSTFSLIPLLILSYKMRYCEWHRLPIYFLFANSIFTEYIDGCITPSVMAIICPIALDAIAITIIISVILRKKYGDRKITSKD